MIPPSLVEVARLMYSEMLFEFGPMEKSPQSGHTSASIEGTARRLRQFRCTYPSCSSTRTNKRNNIERHVWYVAARYYSLLRLAARCVQVT